MSEHQGCELGPPEFRWSGPMCPACLAAARERERDRIAREWEWRSAHPRAWERMQIEALDLRPSPDVGR